VVRRLVILAILAFARRSLYVLTVLQHQEYPEFGADSAGLGRSYDEIYYTGAAHALADGDGFRFGVLEPAQEQGIHPPMTSVALAPVAWLTGDELPMRLLVAAVGALVVLLAGLVALSVAGPRVAYVAAVLAALYPNLRMNDGLLMSESFATAGTAAAILCTYRLLETWSWRWAAGVGVRVGPAGAGAGCAGGLARSDGPDVAAHPPRHIGLLGGRTRRGALSALQPPAFRRARPALTRGRQRPHRRQLRLHLPRHSAGIP
jgi:hypothetical protein